MSDARRPEGGAADAPRSEDRASSTDPGASSTSADGANERTPAASEPPEPEWIQRLEANRDEIIPLMPARTAPPAPKRSTPPKSGILSIDKPAGQTSHDVVGAVRRAAGVRRVGHAGTLDPLATGVLVVCMGSATRVIQELQDGVKRYQARVRLGQATTTYDAEGEVTDERDPSGVTRAAVEAALDDFRGDILQTPPMYSAVKHEGKRLYELAREGIEVEREARPVTVHALELTDWAPPELTLDMTVSKGTYVRTIAHDLGQALGVGAHLADLRRTAVGPFEIDDATPLARVVEAFTEGWWPTLLYPLDTALMGYPALIVDAETEEAIRNGQQIEGPAPGQPIPRYARAYQADGHFIGLLEWDDVTEHWQPRRVFPRPE